MVFKSNVHPSQNVDENLLMQGPLESVALTPAH
jgi:hypothetical protein